MFFRSTYKIHTLTDNLVLIVGEDQGDRSVTNDAENVVLELQQTLDGGIGRRHIYYRDTTGRFDELLHAQGQSTGFKPCSKHQQAFLAGLITSAS